MLAALGAPASSWHLRLAWHLYQQVPTWFAMAANAVAPDEPLARQSRHYTEYASQFAPQVARVALGYERTPSKREELLQDIHFEIWRSLIAFAGDCSLRTWVYRVAHNVGATHAIRQARAKSEVLCTIEDLEELADSDPDNAEARDGARRLIELVHSLKNPDRQIMMLYLEGESAAEISSATGVSSVNVATKIHRLKLALQQQLQAPKSAIQSPKVVS
jgi:RNA polymerase sigma-70 factor, ECF subfamily